MNHDFQGVRRNFTRQAACRLTGRHYSQIVQRSHAEHEELCGLWAVTFCSKNFSPSFADNPLRPLGASAMVVLSYSEEMTARGKRRRQIPLRGFRAEASCDGKVRYGGEAGHMFYFDAAIAPRLNGWRGVLNCVRNTDLIELMQRMDKSCHRQIGRSHRLPVIPQFPEIVLGFAPDKPPVFEDTPALRALAAEQVGVSVDELNGNDPVLLKLLLEEVWERNIVPADAIGNTTGLVLVSADLCTQARAALRILADFTPLLGVQTWNPARECSDFFQAQNPAWQLLERHGIDTSQNFNQPIPDELIDALVIEMRQSIGPAAELFTEEEILDGLTTPHLPLTAWSEALPRLRAKLSPFISGCTTDDDLLLAARRPSQALIASRACKVQICQRQGLLDAEDFRFTSERLGRRIDADLCVEDWPSTGRHISLALNPAVAECRSATKDQATVT